MVIPGQPDEKFFSVCLIFFFFLVRSSSRQDKKPWHESVGLSPTCALKSTAVRVFPFCFRTAIGHRQARFVVHSAAIWAWVEHAPSWPSHSTSEGRAAFQLSQLHLTTRKTFPFFCLVFFFSFFLTSGFGVFREAQGVLGYQDESPAAVLPRPTQSGTVRLSLWHSCLHCVLKSQ